MSTETDILNIQAQIPVESDRPVDILNREEFVDQLLDLINAVSDSNGSCTFSLNGKWGVGKSFVLRMLEERLLTWKAGTKYVVFHYNCWKYDYYEEPLFAIVAAMLEGIDEETHLFSQDARQRIAAISKLSRKHFGGIVHEFSKEKWGIDLSKTDSILAQGKEALNQVKKSADSTYSFDPYFLFNHILKETKEELYKLVQDDTVVVVVDELDRCLPEYAIKVLERLHHLFYGMENCVVAVSIAKDQLDNTIRQVFGKEIEVDHYLRKFFDYQMELLPGTVQNCFSQKYAEYFSLFDESLFKSRFNVDEFCTVLFGDENWEIRGKENMVNRIYTIHKILFPVEKKDYSFLCMELMWTVLKEKYEIGDNMLFERSAPLLKPSDRDGYRLQYVGAKNEFLKYLERLNSYVTDKWNVKSDPAPVEPYSVVRMDLRVFLGPIDIPHLLIKYSEEMTKDKGETVSFPNGTISTDKYKKNIKDFKRFDALLNIIK